MSSPKRRIETDVGLSCVTPPLISKLTVFPYVGHEVSISMQLVNFLKKSLTIFCVQAVSFQWPSSYGRVKAIINGKLGA